MSLQQTASPLVISKAPKRGKRSWAIGVLIAGAAGLWWALSVGYRPASLRQPPEAVLATIVVDRGDVVPVVTENGSVESADDMVIRCRVESFLGLPPGAPAANPGGPPGSQPPQARNPRMQASGGSSSQAASSPAIAAPAGSPLPGGFQRGQGASKARAIGAGAVSTLAGKTTGKGSPAGGGSSSASAALDSTTGLKRPDIRSFDYIVEPHIPLRSTSTDPGPRTGPPPQPPMILAILPEGTRVKAGDVVCELDASGFREELQAQQIRTVRAKAWVQQAKSILEVNEIALREYEQGVFPQDAELIRHYISACQTEEQRVTRNLAWSRKAVARGFRTEAQLRADELTVQKAQTALREAEGMLVRLLKYTGKRIVTARKAKIESARADKLSLDSAYQLECVRLKRIEAMIANCTMRAPREGTVVHANRTNVWGMVEMQIREGLTVYPSQPIFQLPDPKNMRVKATINESQVAKINSGQPATIRIDAFPDRPLRGTVAEITAIPAPANGPGSDVRSYFATVRIDSGGSEALRSGLSAEVDFQVEARHEVPRIPLEAIRWVDSEPFAAVAIAGTGSAWRWRRIALGVSDSTFAEVRSGLEPGDRVIAHTASLPAPKPVRRGPAMFLALQRRHAAP